MSPMTLDQLAQLLDRFSAAGRTLSDQVAKGTDAQIRDATRRLSDAVLELQRNAPQIEALLARCKPEVRAAWRNVVETASRPVKIGVELSALNAASAAARFAMLARISGADTSYAATGDISY